MLLHAYFTGFFHHVQYDPQNSSFWYAPKIWRWCVSGPWRTLIREKRSQFFTSVNTLSPYNTTPKACLIIVVLDNSRVFVIFPALSLSLTRSCSDLFLSLASSLEKHLTGSCCSLLNPSHASHSKQFWAVALSCTVVIFPNFTITWDWIIHNYAERLFLTETGLVF